MKCQYTEQHRAKDLSLAVAYQPLSVSRSGYHKWRKRLSGKVAEEHWHCLLIKQIWEASAKTYGSLRRL